MSHRVDNIWDCWQYYAHQSTLTFLSRLSFVLQTGSWGKRCKLMTRYTFSFAREFYPYSFSGQGWRLLGQGDGEGEGHGCRAPAEQEPRRIIPLLFIIASLPSIYIGQCCQWSDPRLKAFKLCIHYVLIIPNTNQGISWNPFETASQRWKSNKILYVSHCHHYASPAFGTASMSIIGLIWYYFIASQIFHHKE